MRKLKFGLSFLVLLAICGALPPVADRSGPPPMAAAFMQEIQNVLALEQTDLAALQEDLKNAPNEQDALQVLRAIAQRKQDTEIAVLRVQERHARLSGDEEAATRIEQSIRRILNPEPMVLSPEARQESEARRDGGRGHE